MQSQYNLMATLASPENLLNAWRTVRGNIPRYRRQRSAGPDGVTLAEFERDLPAQLSSLRHMLLQRRYEPQRPGLFSIEKRNGGTRKIAVLNVADRVAQRAAQQVIEPLYEPGFLPCSFGFRPGRSIQDAIYCARRLRQLGYSWVVDGDIASCFDSLDHQVLLQKAQKRIHDQQVLELIEKWIQIGIVEHGLPADPANWLAQGWQKASNGVRQGVDWAFSNFPQPQHHYDPYASARYEGALSNEVADGDLIVDGAEAYGDDFDPVDERIYRKTSHEDFNRSALQKRAIKQIAAGGLFMGTDWARRAVAKAGPQAIAALKTPAGREFLKRGLLAGGGALGAAAGVAITAYFLYNQVAPTPSGVLQGSPLSPLLANIYLHSFDLRLTRAGYRLVRFADDWVVMCPDQDTAEKAYNQATIALAQIHLKVNLEKTRILTPSEQLEWLGCLVE